MQYAGFWRRLGAFWLDFIILLPVMAIVILMGEKFRLFDLYWFLPGLILGLWFHVYLVKRYGGTPGKLMLKLRIAMVDGSPVTMQAAAMRYLILFILSTLSSIAGLIGILAITDELYFSLDYLVRSEKIMEMTPSWNKVVNVAAQVWIWSEFITMMFNEKRRAVHDFIAKTVVIRSS